MGTRWDGKIGKIPKISDKRETKRFSPRLTGGEPDFHDCRQTPDFDEERSPGNGREPGQAELYTPETASQYKSQWARYQRALSLNPAAIVQEGKNQVYKFESCDSITGFWEVTVGPAGASYLNIKKPIWQILCPKIIDFDVVDSDGETFTWTQTRGKRTATLDGVVLSKQNSEPFDTEIPKLNILAICLNNGCSDDSVEPIVLNVQPEGQPELFDSVTIYTTPTEIYGGIGFTQLTTSNKVYPIPASVSPPVYLQKVYLMGDRGFTWNPPDIDAEYAVGYVVQQNSTGQYVDIQSSAKPSIFIGQSNSYYRIKILFSSFGLNYESYSDTLIYPAAFTPPTVIADDFTKGISFNYLNNAIVDLPLAVQKIQVTDVDTGIAFNYLNNSITDLPLSVQKIETSPDLHNGLAFVYLRNDITDIPLGGVIIG